MKFSLYRGNLHKVPDIPRRWPLFGPSMSLQVFQKALTKRQEALNCLEQNVECSSAVGPRIEPNSTTGIAAVSDWKDDQEGGEEPASGKNADFVDAMLTNEQNISDDGGSVKENIETEDDGGSKAKERGKRKREDFEFLKMEIDGATVKTEEDSFKVRVESEAHVELAKDMVIVENEKCDRMDCDAEENTTVKSISMAEVVDNAEDILHAQLVKSKCQTGDAEGAKGFTHIKNGITAEDISREKEVEKLEAPRTPVAMDEECLKPAERAAARLDGCGSPSFPSPSEPPFDAHKAKRKAELEEKLKQLQETKHHLVQMLKQVLTNEEESKRRAQGLMQFPGSYVTTGISDRLTEHKTGSDLDEAMKDVKEEYSCLH